MECDNYEIKNVLISNVNNRNKYTKQGVVAYYITGIYGTQSKAK